MNRFKKEGDNWVWNFENLEPTLADDIEVEAIPKVASFGSEDKVCTQKGEKWLMIHTNYEVKASSTLASENGKSYQAENIKNMWVGASWSEGVPGPGISEWLELKPVAPKSLAAIEILPGYWESEELFKANARPKKVLIELNEEHRITVHFPDVMAAKEVPILDYKKPVKKIRLTFQEVWPGARFEDLCVSSVRLQVKLDKEPKITPAR
ncbi:MAG: hypothetical protein HC845_03615 [Akkermansiaceae bacterium]|nr:hypothetical protein [Akkermansiaceae bacterium]